MIKRNDYEYIEIALLKEIPESQMQVFQVNNQEILVIKLKGDIFVYRNSCPHKGYPLYYGELEGKILRCGFHYNKFDITTGKSVGPVTHEDLTKIEHITLDGKLYIRSPID